MGHVLNLYSFRFALNYKGLKYRTEWVEYPDIEPLCKKIGAPPTWTPKNGPPLYTLPVIYDPSTDTVVVDSVRIADYLDKTYPDTPRLFPPGTRALQAAFQVACFTVFGPRQELWKLVALAACLNLNERSQEFFRRTREADEGMKLEEIAPLGSELREENWRAFEEDLGIIAKWYDKARVDGEGPFITGGDKPVHADMVMGGFFLWLRQTLGRDSADWQRVISLDHGRWARFLAVLERYEYVD